MSPDARPTPLPPVWLVDVYNGTVTQPAWYQPNWKAPTGVAVDALGSVYFTTDSAVIMVRPDGTVRLRGCPKPPGACVSLTTPTGVAVDAYGNVYVADQGGPTAGSYRVVNISAADDTYVALAPPPAWPSGTASPVGVAAAANGSVFVTTSSGVYRVDPDNTPSGVATPLDGAFGVPVGIAVDAAGNVFVANSGTNTATLSFIACVRFDGAPCSSAPVVIGGTAGLAVDAAGNVFALQPSDSAMFVAFRTTPFVAIASGGAALTSCASPDPDIGALVVSYDQLTGLPTGECALFGAPSRAPLVVTATDAQGDVASLNGTAGCAVATGAPSRREPRAPPPDAAAQRSPWRRRARPPPSAFPSRGRPAWRTSRSPRAWQAASPTSRPSPTWRWTRPAATRTWPTRATAWVRAPGAAPLRRDMRGVHCGVRALTRAPLFTPHQCGSSTCTTAR